jgi:hypothetical protein
MWIIVPNASTFSASAPGVAGSISALNWQFQALARSAWSRGKPSQSRHWFQRWKRALWLQRLCGAMCEPSMAVHGVAQWTASLAVSRASRIPSPDESAEASMPAICGATHGASSSKRARGSSSSKTSPGCSRRGMTKSLVPSGYGETFANLVSRLRSDCSARVKSARRMDANASSSSAWPTATAISGGANSKRTERGAGGPDLQEVAENWQTPSVADTEGGRMTRSGKRSNEPLLKGQAEALGSAWPTPAARDWKGSNSANHLENGTGRLHLDQLPNFVEHLWSTPRASDGGEGRPEPIVRSGRNATAGADGAMAAADESEFRGEPSTGEFEILQRDDAARIFPPGPGDIDAWRAILAAAPGLEPAIRRLPDGLATSRIDWLRLLGNGVVPLQAAYGLRTLATRLAKRGSLGTARLVRMMEAL